MVFTALILWAMLRWWESAKLAHAWRWLFLISLLIGLDFSVHRTNALLVPGLLVWVLVRYPRTLLSIKAWGAGLSGLVLGLAASLLLIPMALRDPFLNANNAVTLQAWWDYIRLAQAGGGFLVQFMPRKAPLWSISCPGRADFACIILNVRGVAQPTIG